MSTKLRIALLAGLLAFASNLLIIGFIHFQTRDQIVSELAKFRWRSAGQYSCPVVVRAPYGGGIRGGLYHSQSPEAYFCHTTGLQVVIPSTPIL